MFKEFITTFLNYAYAILPWFAVGIIFAWFVETKIKSRSISHYFGQVSLRRLLSEQVLGMISPLSIMSFLPIANELADKGFNPGALLSFFIAERAYDLQSFFIISGLFGMKYAILNALAILVSLFATAMLMKKEFVRFKVKDGKKQTGFWQRQMRLLILVLLGVFIGALLKTLIPNDRFQYFTSGNLSGFLIATILGFLLYFGPIMGNYPVAKAFADLGMAKLGTFAFLTISPILNIVVIMLLGATVGFKSTLKAVFFYSLSATVITLLLSFSF